MPRKRLIKFIAVIQSLLCLIHLFLYETWTFSFAGGNPPEAFWIKLGLGVLSVSFVAVCLAKILSPPKMAPFSLRHSGKSLNSTKNCVEERESSLARERVHATYI